MGLDEYETRMGRVEAFLLSLQQDWGEKDAPDHEATGVVWNR